MSNWISKAVKRPGALRKKAKRAHMSTAAFARKHAHDRGRTGRQARLAMTFRKMKRNKRGSKRAKARR